MQRRTEEAIARKAAASVPIQQQEPPKPKDAQTRALHKRFEASKPTPISKPSPFGASPWNVVVDKQKTRMNEVKHKDLVLVVD